MTLKEFAGRAGVTKRSVYRYVQQGKIAVIRHPLRKGFVIPNSEAERILKAIRGE